MTASKEDQLPATITQADITADQRALNVVPALIADLGDEAAWRYVEFFTANIRNPNTRRAYARACARFFAWCEERGLTPAAIRPHDVATYIEQLQSEVSVIVPAPLLAPTRRTLMVSSGTLFAWAQLPRVARAADRDPRFLAIVLRGAVDGLAIVAPVGDPDWRRLRGEKGLVLDGHPAALPLDGFFALNPMMPNLYRLHRAGQALFVHAVATPYRERSHFDGQDVLESGFAKPGSERYRLAQSRRLNAGPERVRHCAGQAGARDWADHAAGDARPRAGAVVGAPAATAGQWRDRAAPT